MLYKQYPVNDDGQLPWQQDVNIPVWSIQTCYTPFTVPSAGIPFVINEFVNDTTVGNEFLSGNVPFVGFYEPSPGAFLGLNSVQASEYVVTYSGYFIPPEDGKYTFYFAGTGRVQFALGKSTRIFDGASKTVDSGWLDLTGLQQLAYITNTSGGLNYAHSLSAGTAYEIIIKYHKNDLDAGFVAMFANNASFRDPVPLSAGVINDSSEMLPWNDVTGTGNVSIDVKSRSATQLTFSVPLVSNSEARGYYWDEENGYLVNSETGTILRNGRLIQASVGYASDVARTSEVLTGAFSGHITSMSPRRTARGEDVFEITCLDFTWMLKRTISLGYPDWLDYAMAGYLSDKNSDSIASGTLKPAAYDYWNLRKILVTNFIRAGIDSTLLYKKWRQQSAVSYADTMFLLPDHGIILDGNIKYNGKIVGGEENVTEFSWPGTTGEFIYDVVLKVLDNFGLELQFCPGHSGAPMIISPNAPMYQVYGRQLANWIVKPYTDFEASFPDWWNIGEEYSYSRFLVTSPDEATSRVISSDRGTKSFNAKLPSDGIVLGGAVGWSKNSMFQTVAGCRYTISFMAKNNGTSSVNAILKVFTRQHADVDTGRYDRLHPWSGRTITSISSSSWKRYTISLIATTSEWINPVIGFSGICDVLIDGIELHSRSVPPTESDFNAMNPWMVKATSGAIGGEFLESAGDGSTIEVVLPGSRFDIITVLGPDGGAYLSSGLPDTDTDTFVYKIERLSNGETVVGSTGVNLFNAGVYRESPVISKQILYNGSFEDSILGGVPGYWGTKDNSGDVWSAPSTSYASHGSYSWKLHCDGPSSSITGYQSIVASAGKSHICSLKYKLVDANGAVKVRVQSSGLDEYVVDSTYSSYTSDWQTAVFSFVPESSSTSFDITVQGDVDVYIDEVAVKEVDNSSQNDVYWAYYDGDGPSGGNPALISVTTDDDGDPLVYDVYKITIETSSSDYITRINAIRAYAINGIEIEEVLYTGGPARGNVGSISANDAFDDMRNDCVVVGSRTATVVADEDNGLNKKRGVSTDFIFARTVMPQSIYDKTSSNYAGFPVQTLIFEPDLRSDARAQHISYMLVKKYSRLAYEPRFTMVGHPNMFIASCVGIHDHKTGVINGGDRMWVTEYTHNIGHGYFTTDISVSQFEPLQSYVPKLKPIYLSDSTIITNLDLIRELTPNDAMSPDNAFDPYESEMLGKHVKVRFDLAIDCFLKVEIVDIFSDIPVAILTDPSASSDQDGFVRAEQGVIEYTWDGVNSYDNGENLYNKVNSADTDDGGLGYYVKEKIGVSGVDYGKFYVRVIAKDTANLNTYTYSTTNEESEKYIYTKRGPVTTYVTSATNCLAPGNMYSASKCPQFNSDGVILSGAANLDRNCYVIDIEADIYLFFQTYLWTNGGKTPLDIPGSSNQNYHHHTSTFAFHSSFSGSEVSAGLEKTVSVLSGALQETFSYQFRIESDFNFSPSIWTAYIDRLARDSKYGDLWSRVNPYYTGNVIKKIYYAPAVRFKLIMRDKSGRGRTHVHAGFWHPRGFDSYDIQKIRLVDVRNQAMIKNMVSFPGVMKSYTNLTDGSGYTSAPYAHYDFVYEGGEQIARSFPLTQNLDASIWAYKVFEKEWS